MSESEQTDFAGDALEDAEFLVYLAKGQEFLATRNGYSYGIQRAHLVTVKSVSRLRFTADLPDLYTASFYRKDGREMLDKRSTGEERWLAHAVTEAGRAYLAEERGRHAVWQLRNQIKFLVSQADSDVLIKTLALLEAEVKG